MQEGNTRFRPESLAVTQLFMRRDDRLLGPATGFFYKLGQDFALITNWHVFSGINPTSGETLHSTGQLPNRVDFNINIISQDGKLVDIRGETISLLDNSQSHWWQHTAYLHDGGTPRLIDIGAVMLKDHIKDYGVIRERIVSLGAHVLLNTDSSGAPSTIAHAYPRVGSDVFILGYPRGLTKQGVLPIWKRGSVASEPLFFVLDQTPAMLVDAVTRAGMSGSPVLCFGNDFTDENGRSRHFDAQTEPILVGVYAGREGVTSEEVDMALGRVWHRKLLDEIFFMKYREPGQYRLPIQPS